MQKQIEQDIEDRKVVPDPLFYRRLTMKNNVIKRPSRVDTVKVKITKDVVNVEGNNATIVIEGEVDMTAKKTSKLNEDERLIRRIRNRQRRRLRSLRNTRKHGRAV